jgi:hypothetical protein
MSPEQSASTHGCNNPRRLSREIVEFAFSDLDPHLPKDYRFRHKIPAGAKFPFLKVLHDSVDKQNAKITAKRLREAVRNTFKDCEDALTNEFQRRPSEEVRRVIQILLLTITPIHEVVCKYTQSTSRSFSSKDLRDILYHLHDYTTITRIIYDFRTDSNGCLILGEKIARLEQQLIGGGRAYKNSFVLETVDKIDSLIIYLPKDFALDRFFSDKQTHTIQEKINRWSPKRFVIRRQEPLLIDVFIMTRSSLRWYQFFVGDSELVLHKEDQVVDPNSAPFQSGGVGA